MAERLYHVSETPDLTQFEPRVDARGRNLVWAIGESRLHNYLLPRDCPRITYYATAATSAADRAEFFSATPADGGVTKNAAPGPVDDMVATNLRRHHSCSKTSSPATTRPHPSRRLRIAS